MIDIWEQPENIVGVLASGAKCGNPSLPSGEHLALVVVEGRTARRLVVDDEGIELVEGG